MRSLLVMYVVDGVRAGAWQRRGVLQFVSLQAVPAVGAAAMRSRTTSTVAA